MSLRRRGSKSTSAKLSVRKPSDISENGTFQSCAEEKETGNKDTRRLSTTPPPKPPRLRPNGLARLSFRSSEAYDMSFKIMLLGDSGVGKTCFLIRYKDRSFLAGTYISTVGIDFRNKIITVDNTKVKLQIWDTAGQERFRSVTQAYYRDAHGVMVIYDVSNSVTFDHTKTWFEDVKKFGNDEVVAMLVGNKADVSSARKVTTEQGKKFAQENDMLFMETSAKTGMNIDRAFVEITRVLVRRQEGKPKDRGFDISHSAEEGERKLFGCCGTR